MKRKTYYEGDFDFETTTPNFKKILDEKSKISFSQQIQDYYNKTKKYPKVYSWALSFNSKYREDIIYKDKINVGINIKEDVITYYGISINSFFSFILKQNKNWKFYAHNLKGFDGHYILPYLEEISYFSEKPDNVKKEDEDKDRREELNNFYGKKKGKEVPYYKPLPFEYTYKIEKNKKIYTTTIYIPATGKNKSRNKLVEISFEDNLLMFNTSVNEMGKQLTNHFINKGMNKEEAEKRFLKENIDYFKEDLYKNLNELEQDNNGLTLKYLLKDSYILCKFRELMDGTLSEYDFGIKKWKRTQGATAVESWKEIFGNYLIEKNKNKITEIKQRGGGSYYVIKGIKSKKFSLKKLQEYLIEKILPTEWLKQDNVFETVYWYYGGGISKVNEIYRGIYLKDIDIYDIVSSYPDTMNSDLLCPVGNPVDEKDGDVHLIKLYIKKRIENKYGLPFLRKRSFNIDNELFNDNSDGMKTEYKKILEPGEEYFITNYEFDRFIKYYNPSKNSYEKRIYLSFKGVPFKTIFGDYINHWYSLKEKSKEIGNDFLKNFAKVMLNALYGKFGTKIEHIYYKFLNGEYIKESERSDFIMYLPIAIFITACARMKLVDAVDIHYDLFGYCDTDSIFVKKEFPINNLKIGKELGNWEKENKHSYNLIVRRSKQYIAECIYGQYCKDCKKSRKLAFAGINFMRDDNSIDYNITGEEITNEQKKFKETLTFNDFIYGKEIPNQLTPIKIANHGIVIYENEKEIPPIWHYPLMNEQIYKTEKQFIENYKKSRI